MTNEQPTSEGSRRRRGRKPYPTLEFADSLELPKAIVEAGVPRVRRLTLFKQQLQRSPGSSLSRQLIATSARYGLTTGNYNSEFLELTDHGEIVAGADPGELGNALRLAFDMAIMSVGSFGALYEQLNNKRVPAAPILQDMLEIEGIDEADREEASSIFLSNARFLGLIQNLQGTDYLVPLEQLLEERPSGQGPTAEDSPDGSTEEPLETQPQTTKPTPSQVPVREPSVHIDVQIHIDSSASSDQIDQIFLSMAKHLYGREG